MTFLTYSAAAVIAFSGVFAGAFLTFFTKEEMPTARKYFPWLQKALFLAIIAILFDFFKVNGIIMLIAFILILFMIVKKQTMNSYPLLAIIFFLLGQGNESLFMISALIFIYGFPTGSLFAKQKTWQATIKPVLLKYGIFLILAIGLQALYSVFVLKTF
ncbi:hypothetical protein IIC68_03165 [archaeon]|nr:hypothetical protein [archaeon]